MILNTFRDILDIFPQAIIGGSIMAAACSIIGVFVILKRIVFISVALSETAACGIAIALIMGINPTLGAILLTLSIVAVLSIDYESSRLPRDAVLGFIFLLASSLSVLLVSSSGMGLHEVKTMLYGDLILTGNEHLQQIICICVPAILFITIFVRPISYSFVDREYAKVMGIKCRIWELLFFCILGLVVSACSRSGGVMLVFSFLAVIPSAALLLARKLSIILILAPIMGIMATMSGFYISYEHDLPTNQTIILTCCVLFILAIIISRIQKLLSHYNNN